MMINTIVHGSCLDELRNLESESVDCCVTSPPYWGLRDYGVDGQLGLEKTPEQYVSRIVEVFREVRRVIKPEGTLWLNLGDSYAGSVKGIGSDHGKAVFTDDNIVKTDWKQAGLKPKDLVGIPWMVAFALRADGWYLRQDIIWHKPNPMPESVTDRCTKSHEYIFLMSKSGKYYCDMEAIKEDSIELNWQSRLERESLKSAPTEKINGIRTKSTFGNRNGELNGLHSGNIYTETGKRNKRSVWTVTTKPFSEAHFATFPEDLIVDCIKAGCPENGIGIDLNAEYIKIANTRLERTLGMFI